VPLIVLLFLLFPRVTTGFRLLLTPNLTSASGFSDRLSPGSVESLASSTAVAFRAEFPDGNLPPRAPLYWRGLVLTQGEGMEWRSREAPRATAHSPQEVRSGNTIRQWVTIEPHGENWMFALDRPVTAPPGAFLTPLRSQIVARNCASGAGATRTKTCPRGAGVDQPARPRARAIVECG